ncbi:MAG: ABC transporter ATP-binding protein [Clostridiales bacterium]|nr:ABC transporter ATP-binding protein [Clostridiales bacterium]
MIEVKNLTKRYGTNVAVSDLSFRVESGQVYGFLGPNGAGKSTTMNIITGCLAATDGQVIIDGHDIFEEPDKAKRCIGYLPEIPPLYPDMTPYEYLSFVGMAKGLKGVNLKDGIAKVSEITGITDVLHRLIRNLSKGYKQRVGIAQALIGDPEIVILDEPTVGLDPIQIIEIRDLIKNLGKKHTVILSSHILSEVSAICDEILIISKGKLVANDTTENLSTLFETDSTLELQVKGSVDKIKEILEGIEGVKDVKITDATVEGVITAEASADKDKDIREAVFYAMQKADCPLLSMNVKKTSLEDAFLNLTAGDAAEKNRKKSRKNKNKEDGNQ